MIYQTKIFKGILHPKRSFFQLEKAEVVYGLFLRIFLFFLASAIIFTVNGIFGIGSHGFSFQMLEKTSNQFEWLKSYFTIGRFILGLIYAGMMIFFTAFWFWTLTDVPYKKLVTLQSFVFPILLLEQIILILLVTLFNLPWYSSPFSLGIIAQSLMSNEIVIFFLGSISLFKIWVIAIQSYGLRILTNKSRASIISIVVGIHLIYWLATSLLAFVDFKKLL